MRMRRMRITGVSKDGEDLAYCDYCIRQGRASNLTEIIFDDHNVNFYCPNCLPEMWRNACGTWREEPMRKALQRKKDALR